jgi:hypothetical protein
LKDYSNSVVKDKRWKETAEEVQAKGKTGVGVLKQLTVTSSHDIATENSVYLSLFPFKNLHLNGQSTALTRQQHLLGENSPVAKQQKQKRNGISRTR